MANLVEFEAGHALTTVGAAPMSAIPKKKLTPAEYLEIERMAPTKSEFYNGEMFAMAGASIRHTIIKDNICGELRMRLRGQKCQALSSDQRVKVSRTGLYTYPDVVVACGEMRFDDAQQDTLLNPNAIVEVLSDSTEKYDRGGKFKQYRNLESLTEYILVAQDSPTIDRFTRQPDGTWNLTSVSGLDVDLEFDSLKVRIPMAEIYRNVDFDKPETNQE